MSSRGPIKSNHFLLLALLEIVLCTYFMGPKSKLSFVIFAQEMTFSVQAVYCEEMATW
jgi:hypothetical protein